MPPPPTSPRLDKINDRAVAKQMARAIESHLSRLAEALELEMTLEEATEAQQGCLVLVTWAKTGQTKLEVRALDMLRKVKDALYLRAVDNPEEGADAHPNIETELGLVLAAAMARDRITRKEPVTGPMLAALGGVNLSRVRQMVRAGELRRLVTVDGPRGRMDAPIRPSDAARWLAARGVPGFDREAA